MRTDTQISRRPRGRPRQYDPDRALWRAMETFWERGYSATSLDDLSAATGMNRPSLYAAFGDKQSLYLKALRRFRDEMRRAIGALDRGTRPLAEDLYDFYCSAIDFYTTGAAEPRGCLIIGTASVEAVAEPKIRSLLREVLDEIDRALAARFAKAIKAGQLASSREPAEYGWLAAAVLHSLAVRSRAGESPRRLKRFARAAISLTLG